MKREHLAVIVNCIVEELNDMQLIAILNLGKVTFGGKKPVKFQNTKFQCLLKAYSYFTTILAAMDNDIKKFHIEAPDNLVLGATVAALKNTDNDKVHELVGTLHLKMNNIKFDKITDWLEILSTTTVDDILIDINESIAYTVAAMASRQ